MNEDHVKKGKTEISSLTDTIGALNETVPSETAAASSLVEQTFAQDLSFVATNDT